MQGQREHLSREHRDRGEPEPPETSRPEGASRWPAALVRICALVARLLRAALHALVPRRCAACDEPCAEGDLCLSCIETLEDAEHPAALAPYAYGGALAEAVRRAKFRPDERPARALARLFTSGVLERWPALGHSVDVIAWVPLHPGRLRTRGFDLAALLADALSRELHVPCRPLLSCERHDPPLSRGADVEERARRVRERYQARGDVIGRRVLLVDDVVTSGATLGEAARVLTEAGAREVVCMALAATPSWSQASGGRMQRQVLAAHWAEGHGAAGSPDQSFPRSMKPHILKSARRDQTG